MCGCWEVKLLIKTGSSADQLITVCTQNLLELTEEIIVAYFFAFPHTAPPQTILGLPQLSPVYTAGNHTYSRIL